MIIVLDVDIYKVNSSGHQNDPAQARKCTAQVHYPTPLVFTLYFFFYIFPLNSLFCEFSIICDILEERFWAHIQVPADTHEHVELINNVKDLNN